MKRIALAAIALAMCAPAHAQTDSLCASLDKLIAMAPGAVPFATLIPADKPVPSFARIDAPAGFDGAVSCEVYFAGTAEKVLGGGTHNKAGCVIFKGSDTSDKSVSTKGRAAANAMVARVSACLTPKGWTADPVDSNFGGRETITRWRFAKAGGIADVSVEMSSMVYGRSPRDMSTEVSVSANVRTLNPKDPSYKSPS